MLKKIWARLVRYNEAERVESDLAQERAKQAQEALRQRELEARKKAEAENEPKAPANDSEEEVEVEIPEAA